MKVTGLPVDPQRYFEIKKRCGKNTVLRHVHTIFRPVTTVTNTITFTAFIYVTKVTQRPA